VVPGGQAIDCNRAPHVRIITVNKTPETVHSRPSRRKTRNTISQQPGTPWKVAYPYERVTLHHDFPAACWIFDRTRQKSILLVAFLARRSDFRAYGQTANQHFAFADQQLRIADQHFAFADQQMRIADRHFAFAGQQMRIADRHFAFAGQHWDLLISILLLLVSNCELLISILLLLVSNCELLISILLLLVSNWDLLISILLLPVSIRIC